MTLRHVQKADAAQPVMRKFVQAIGAHASDAPVRKLRVAGYCRVSTGAEAQRTSIEAQRAHYRAIIEANPEWELVDVYWEAGVSGARAENRPQLQRLLADCRAGRIDLVVTKSISRFSRNTSDCLGLVRQLTSLGVTLRFEKERIQTDRMESEFLFTVLAAFAQEESRTISTNMKWGIRKRFEAGTYRPPRAPYGYRKVPRPRNACMSQSAQAASMMPDEHNGIFIIESVEAEVVRGIFHAAIDGKGAAAIAAELNEARVPTWSEANGVGETDWAASTVRSIVANPFYTGDALYQKTYVDDAYHQRRNCGELDRYLCLGAHPAIIDRETFEAANAMMGRASGKSGCDADGLQADGVVSVLGGDSAAQHVAGFAGNPDGRSATAARPPDSPSSTAAHAPDGALISTSASNPAVKVIKASRPTAPTTASSTTGSAASAAPAKLRVCAYCRVSSNSPEQETSYEAQVVHYTNYIQANPEWTLVGIFADEGISGTQAKKRPEFNRMIDACERGDVDMVVTKSISRFARNTLDCLNYIRRLKELKIPIIFEKESINTLDATGEMLVTILASIAQQESKSISDNVRMGIEFGFQEGRGRLNYTTFLGYTGAGTPGQLAIVHEEARLVRRIYREYLEGRSPGMIANRLMDDGIPTSTGGSTWYASTVASILRNEKYCGDLLMQKYFTEDFLTHKVVRNTGQRTQYFVEDDHEPIVPKAVFRQVQRERERRAALKGEPARLRYGSRSALAGRLVCGKCGRTLKRYACSDGRLADWRCRQRAKQKKRPRNDAGEPAATRCDCRVVSEPDVKSAILDAFNELPGRRTELLALRDELSAHRDEVPAHRTEPLTQLEHLAESETASADAQSAELANNEMQVRILLELLDEMDARAQRTLGVQAELAMGAHVQHASGADIRPAIDVNSRPAPNARPRHSPTASAQPAPTSAACYDYEDFFARTRYEIPRGVLNDYGEMARFDDDLVTRHLKCVIVLDSCYEVRFKAGISIRVGA